MLFPDLSDLLEIIVLDTVMQGHCKGLRFMGRFIYRPHCRDFQNSVENRKRPPTLHIFTREPSWRFSRCLAHNRKSDTAMEQEQSLCCNNCNELAFQAFKESPPHSKLLEGQSLHYQFTAKSR